MTEQKTPYRKPTNQTLTNVGYIHQQPELRFSANGKAMLFLSIGIDNSYSVKNADGSYSDERKGQTDWFNATAWGYLAEKLAELPLEGATVGFDFKLGASDWVDNDGNDRTTQSLNLSNLWVIETRPSLADGSGTKYLKPLPQPMVANGYIHRAPEIKQTDNGTTLASFSVALDNTYPIKDADGNFTGERGGTSDWFNCVAWDRVAERISQFDLEKQNVGFRFKLKKNYWTDPTTDSKREAAQLVIEDLWVINTRPAESDSNSMDDDDI